MPVTIVVPQLGESVVEGTIGKWLKKVGEPIAKDEPIVEIITDKINIELPAPTAGTLGQILLAEGTVAQVGQELGLILAPGESLADVGTGAAPALAAPALAGAGVGMAGPPPAMAGPPPRAAVAAPDQTSTDGRVISPAVRKLLRDHELDIAQIRGTGTGGRVTREDVLAHVETRKAGGEAAPTGLPAFAAPPSMDASR